MCTPSVDTSRAPVGIIGLGLLGTALAERLIQAQYPVVVHNRSRSKADPLLAMGATWSDNPLAQCQCVVICLYTSEVVEQVLNQLSDGYQPGQFLIDTTTGNPEHSAALGARLAEQNINYLEAPIAASSEQTRQGKALSFVAGSKEAYSACESVIRCLAPKSFYVGTWGNAAKIKLVNNLVLGLNRLALAEGLVFAKAIGLDASTTLAMLQQSNSYSSVMDVKGEKMVHGDFSTQAKLSQHRKDVGLILQQADRHGIALPVSALHHELLGQAESAGLGEADNCAIIQTIEKTRPAN
jgi:3-hydroxyisobutyrate dehydrogenase-like beta-hydroxyacid dehydrogenase